MYGLSFLLLVVGCIFILIGSWLGKRQFEDMPVARVIVHGYAGTLWFGGLLSIAAAVVLVLVSVLGFALGDL